MADYYIKCKKEDSSGVIESVGMATTLSGSTSSYAKSTVVYYIDTMKKDIWTAYYQNGTWKLGDHVHTVDGKYIRTDGNSVKKDNLGNLPEC
ncbi:MAG TPA: DUF3892 domain-containing protein [bacterium]|nr:DUF3892 domain-containing protein [bacterium]